MVGFGQVQGQVPGRRARALPAPATSQAKSLSLPDFRRSVSPNSSFKPTPLRYTKHMAGAACHVLCSTTRRGLTQALGVTRRVRMSLNRLVPMQPVASMPASVEFYEKLGFSVENRNDEWGWAMLRCGDCRLMVDQSI